MTVKNLNGYELDFTSSVPYMDDDVRETVHHNLAPCDEQEFFTAYEKAHIAKFGAEWELSKQNPVW